jgi:hypothetical protein
VEERENVRERAREREIPAQLTYRHIAGRGAEARERVRERERERSAQLSQKHSAGRGARVRVRMRERERERERERKTCATLL